MAHVAGGSAGIAKLWPMASVGSVACMAMTAIMSASAVAGKPWRRPGYVAKCVCGGSDGSSLISEKAGGG